MGSGRKRHSEDELEEEVDQDMNASQEDITKERLKDEKRKIRQQYRQLITDTEVRRKELMDPNNNELLVNVDKANTLYKNVFGTHEATLDAKLLVLSADLGMQKAKYLRMGQGGFDETEYLTKLVNVMGGHEVENDDRGLDWAKMGRMAAKWTRKAPTMDFMLGPMAIEHKTRQMKQRTRVVRDPKDMKKPQELREEDIARQENETTKNVMQISAILEELEEKVNFFELVVNPESFAQTVENIFYLSFLVRDGKVSISEVDMDDPDREDDGEVREGANYQPMVELTETPTAEDYQNGLLKKQMVMDIDMATWKEVIEVYDIKKTMIPTRLAKETMEKGKWYG
ncbi:nuclear protein [Gryganskiella cystojenkinii]|nr:nuclear protein [Gryganskiella cystojenkinii]